MRNPLNIQTLTKVFADVLNVKYTDFGSNKKEMRIAKDLAVKFHDLHLSGGDLSTFAPVIDQAKKKLS